MRNLILTTLLAATFALSPVSSAQAQMTNEQINQLLLGIATIGAVGFAIDKLKDRKDDDRNDKDKKEKPVRYDRDRHDGDHAYRRVLPARCMELVHGHDGKTRRVFGRQCLRQHVHRSHRLPQRCEREVYAFGRHRDVYGARCLQRSGWTVARHR